MESSASSPSPEVADREASDVADMEALAKDLLSLPGIAPLKLRSTSFYDKLHLVGEGGHAKVHKARGRETGQLVALKEIRKYGEEIIPPEAQHEIIILKCLNHENVIQLKEIAFSPVHGNDEKGRPEDKYKGAYMVFDFMDHDLVGLSLSESQFTVPQIKCYMKQLLTGVQHCHATEIMHRDIKSANILVNNEGYLKLADFGLARVFREDGVKLTNEVVSLWYRAPELLLGETEYGPAVDMWSVGCVFGDLLCRKPIFRGTSQQNQFEVICQTCGTPDEDNWPDVSKLPKYQAYMPPSPVRRQLRERFKDFDPHALDLLERMLTLNPAKRISAKDALDSDYFRLEPLPCDRESLPKYPEESHEYSTMRKRRRLNPPEGTDKELPLAGPGNEPPAGPSNEPPAGQGGGPDTIDQQLGQQ